MSRPAAPLLALAALLLTCTRLGADTQTFTYAGDSMNTILAEGNQQAFLNGHARVETEDMKITADQIRLFGKDFIYAQCTGNVHVVDSKRGIDLKSEHLFYDRDQKISRVTGDAVMADVKNEMVVKGGFIEDRDPEKLTIIQIGVRILKKDLVCRAEFAKYWRDKKILELSGMPWVSRKSDVYQAARITINLDTDEISLEGDVSGTIQTETKEKSKETTPAPEGTPAGPEGPGAKAGSDSSGTKSSSDTTAPKPAPGAPPSQQQGALHGL